MKKWTALLLALIMCLALCACGGGLDKNDTASYLGEWKSESGEYSLLFNKGGIGKYTTPTGFLDFTYEVEDEVVVLTIEDFDMKYVASFELNDDGTVLSVAQNGLPVYNEDQLVFTKAE